MKRKDSKGAKATKAVPSQYVASRPLEVVQIDHTEFDLFLVDEKTTREAMGVRPWVTLGIDVFTSTVVGFHLSMNKIRGAAAVTTHPSWKTCEPVH